MSNKSSEKILLSHVKFMRPVFVPLAQVIHYFLYKTITCNDLVH